MPRCSVAHDSGAKEGGDLLNFFHGEILKIPWNLWQNWQNPRKPMVNCHVDGI
jgi:hypothetical protein